MFGEMIKPKYEYIAYDIAKRIVDGQFSIGERLYGRSNLAGIYKVSPETIRRAVSLLQDMGVVVSEHGRGIVIKSREAAQRYINQFNERQTLEVLRKELFRVVKERKKLDEQLEMFLLKFTEYINRWKNITELNPIEICVSENSAAVGKSLSDLRFREVTGATVVAIKRAENTIISPSPDMRINAGDYLVLVGDEDAFKKSMYLVGEYIVMQFEK